MLGFVFWVYRLCAGVLRSIFCFVGFVCWVYRGCVSFIDTALPTCRIGVVPCLGVVFTRQRRPLNCSGAIKSMSEG